MSSWLQRQKKGELVALANEAGAPIDESAKKDDILEDLEKYLRANSTRLAGNPAFKDFYDRTSSPVKRATGTGPTSDAEKRVRRKTKVKEDHDDSETSPKALVARTPRAVQRVAANVPLPPSPAVLAQAVEQQTARARAEVGRYWAKSGVPEAAVNTRELLSSVIGVDTVILLLEWYGVQRDALPWRYQFDIPSVQAIGTPSHAVHLPDFFLLLSSSFWAPTTLWSATSFFIPLLFAYFFNFTLKGKPAAGTAGGIIKHSTKKPAYKVDPLTFNVAKALVSWLVYAQGFRFYGIFNDATVERVHQAVPGGYQGILIGSAIGGLVSFYDAVLKK